jgi:U3 small nucleolar RNA-associated protein 10
LAIDKHPKSSISKNAAPLSRIFFSALDLRRVVRARESGDDEVAMRLDELEVVINEVALKMIYKLNDATFRPMFSDLIEWAASGLPKSDTVGRTRRLESVYGFLEAFFGSLRSIVTSYSSYVFEGAAKILKTVDIGDLDQQELWKRVLKTLTKSFEHDQDSFWQAPSHFSVVAPVLVQQFLRADAVDTFAELTPAIVELAAAADSREHQKELNTSMLKLLRHEAAAVRLSVIKCEQTLAERLGEEWLQTLPEMLPYISELQDDDDEAVERENRRWIVRIEETLGENLDAMLQ